jgi:flavin-dependent dehydrogenase
MKADVAVVGGGPAGAATALLLAREGFDVALFDRTRFPRSKPCGEFLNPGAVRLLRSECGLALPEDAEPVRTVKLVPAHGPPLEVPLVDAQGNRETGYSLRRVRTDQLLLEAAKRVGVRVFEGHSVRDAECSNLAGVDNEGEPFHCEARLVIAADGTHSVIARRRGVVLPIRRLHRIGLVGHFTDVPGSSDGSVRMFAARKGVWGISGFSRQADGGAVLSASLPQEAATGLSDDDRRFVRDMAGALPGLEFLSDAGLEGVQTTACFGHRLSRPWDEGVLFVGDAAEFVDPFTGEGVHHALDGALAAATTARMHLKAGGPLAEYVELRKRLQRRYVVCDVVQALVNRPALLSMIAANLRRRPRAAERLIAELVDLLPPGGALSPRMLADALLPSLS